MKESQRRFSITLLSSCFLELLSWLPSPTNCHHVTSLTTCRMKCSMNATLSSPKLPSVMASSTVTENKEDNASDYSSLGQPHWSSLLSWPPSDPTRYLRLVSVSFHQNYHDHLNHPSFEQFVCLQFIPSQSANTVRFVPWLPRLWLRPLSRTVQRMKDNS